MLRPWILQMREQGLCPRTLADDLMLTTEIDTSPTNTLTRFAQGFNLTIQHLIDLGGKIAPKKSKLLATMANHRNWLARYTWEPIHAVVEVVHQMRDLGSQLVLGGQECVSISRARLKTATATVRRIHRLPHSRKQKIHFVKAVGHAQGLYSAEASHIDEIELDNYSRAVLDAIGPGNQMRSKAMVYALADDEGDICPSIAILHKRVQYIRRMHARWPDLYTKMLRIFDQYARCRYKGAAYRGLDTSKLRPAPPPGDARRAGWKNAEPPRGPIGLVLQNAHYAGIALDVRHGIIHRPKGHGIRYLELPYQQLKTTIIDLGQRAMIEAESHNRT
eukprot:6180102-Karenia_brevis.AAC.1